MNFLSAIKHASIGYAIRRKVWRDNAMLHLDKDNLYWINCTMTGMVVYYPYTDDPCIVLGTDKGFDLTEEDIKSLDWEVI